MSWFSHYNYWIVIFLMMIGLYIVICRDNLARKVIGLNVFQTSVFVLFISIGAVRAATAPILAVGFTEYANPLPHVLILTAIVVGDGPQNPSLTNDEWQEHYDPTFQRPFWYNTRTRESSWDALDVPRARPPPSDF